MTIEVKCPGCQQEYKLSDSLAGKKAKCKACGGVIQIPANDLDDLVDFDEPPPVKSASVKSAPAKVGAPPPLPTKAASAAPKPPIPKAAPTAPLPKISVTCDMCFSDFQAKGELAGKKMKCPECGEPVAVPAAKSKAKAKAKPADDDDDGLFADDVEFVDDFDDEPELPRKRGSKEKDRPKKKSKGSRRSNDTEYFLDNIPIPALLGGMWTMIIVGCVLLVMFGKSPRNGAAVANENAGGWNNGPAAPPVMPVQGGLANEPYNLAAVPVPAIPEPGPMLTSPTGGFSYVEAQFSSGNLPGGMTRLRVRFPIGQHAAQTLGCVLLGSAGTPMIWGNGLAEVDYYQESQLYIQAGLAVCEYSMDGENLEESDDEMAEMKAAYEKFAAADAGLINVRNAIEFVLAKLPQINPNRMYIAGHSSAGATALLAAAHEPRIKACIAYCAPTNLLQRQQEMLNQMNVRGFNPDVREFLQRSSPMTHVARIQCPVFLFHGMSDDVVAASESQQLNDRLQQLGRPVMLRLVPSNDHYESMTTQGMPLAVIWLKEQASERALVGVGQGGAAAAPMP